MKIRRSVGKRRRFRANSQICGKIRENPRDPKPSPGNRRKPEENLRNLSPFANAGAVRRKSNKIRGKEKKKRFPSNLMRFQISKPLTRLPNFKKSDCLSQSLSQSQSPRQSQMRECRKKLWGACPPPTVFLDTPSFGFDFDFD